VGEYDISRTADLRDAIRSQHEGTLDVVVDLAGVTFIDSSGLRALREVRNALQDRGVRLTVEHPSRLIQRLLEITAMTELAATPARDPLPCKFKAEALVR
jgi:anti-sigma B factor antagonist